jgi:hypothetical protein
MISLSRIAELEDGQRCVRGCPVFKASGNKPYSVKIERNIHDKLRWEGFERNDGSTEGPRLTQKSQKTDFMLVSRTVRSHQTGKILP